MPHVTIHPPYHIRKLWPLDRNAFRRHLLRLDHETRLARFGTAVNDSFLNAYADTAKRTGTLIYGAFIGHEMHGSAELRSLHDADDDMAEAAFAVEAEHQHHGLGSALMDRIIQAAQNRNIGQVHMICMRENHNMKRLAEKFGARFRIVEGESTGEIVPDHATEHSLLDEAIHDETEFITAVLDWQSELPDFRKSA